ncbi:MAG: hypothetical protein HY075_06575 [Deltaproteobacteria bacterium]|nr:hypothetical protein [Deltaproteobacteria bacterium]
MGSRKLRKLARRFLEAEDGQATTEYVMLMAVLVGIIITLGKVFRDRMVSLVKGPVSNMLKQSFFRPGGVHKFPISLK